MLMCAVCELEPGWVVGAPVRHPVRRETQLVSEGTSLTQKMIEQLERQGVTRVWVTGDFAPRDYDRGATRQLSEEQRFVYDALAEDFAGRARSTISNASVQKYRARVLDLVMKTMSNRAYASMAARMGREGDQVFAHAAGVAYLCVVAGLELEPYIIRERSRLSTDRALDHASLGLAGLLHDVGKANCDHEVRELHEVHLSDDDDEEAYREHIRVGYEMLEYANAPASVRVAVRMHHQRWDGSGWPCGDECGLPGRGCVGGSMIHIYSRIVAAANALDNLLTSADGSSRPPVAALAEFASARFDGWFDPVVRTALLRAVQPFAVGSRVVLSDGTACVVAEPEVGFPCLPRVVPLEEEEAPIPLVKDERRIARHEGADVSAWFYEAGAVARETGASCKVAFESRGRDGLAA